MSISLSNPIIAIATVVKDDLSRLRKTVRSVYEQSTSHEFEYIIHCHADDAQSIQYCKSLANPFHSKSNLSYLFSSGRDSGIYDAMNKALELSNAQFIIYLNCGDIFFDDLALDRLIKELFSRRAEWCHNCIHYHSPFAYENESIYYNVVGFLDVRASVLRGRLICQQSIIYNVGLLRQSCFDTAFRYASDYKSVISELASGYVINTLPLVTVRYQAGGLSELNQNSVSKEIQMIRLQYSNTFFEKAGSP